MDCLQLHILAATTISTFGVIGNGVAFCTFGKIRNRNASTYLFRALAVVDSVFLVMYCIPHLNNLMLINNFWTHFADFCLLWQLYGIAHTATIWSILLVGLYRYIVVCQPLKAARVCTVGNARRHFFGVILLSFIVNFPEFFVYKIKEITLYNHTDEGVTYEFVETNMGSSAWYYTGYRVVFIGVVINYAIPVGSLIFITVRLCQSLRSSRQRRMELSEGQREDRANSRAQWMVIIVLIMFLICHTGLVVHIVLDRFGILWRHGETFCKSVWFILYALADSMMLLNSCINVIYILGLTGSFANYARAVSLLKIDKTTKN